MVWGAGKRTTSPFSPLMLNLVHSRMANLSLSDRIELRLPRSPTWSRTSGRPLRLSPSVSPRTSLPTPI